MSEEFDKAMRDLEGLSGPTRRHSDRVKGKPAEAQTPETTQPEGYEAFAVQDRVHRVSVRPKRGVAYSLLYANLLVLAYDDEDWSEIFLTVSGMTVTVKGRHLRPIVDALDLHTCKFIEAYQPHKHPAPPEGAPVVESIDVRVIGSKTPEKLSEKQ